MPFQTTKNSNKMTELQLYKWVHENGIECHYNHNFTELWACPDSNDMEKFFKIAPATMFDDGGIDCKLCDGYVAIDLIPIAVSCDI